MTTDLDQRVTKLEADMEATQAILRQLAESQVRTEQTMNRLSEQVDSFAFEAQRVLGIFYPVLQMASGRYCG
jgi:cell division protein FtsB